VDEQDIKWLCQSVSLRGELFQKMLEVDQFLLACEAGSTAYFESLMDRSVDAVKLASNNNWFFFRYACTRGHVGLVRFLSANKHCSISLQEVQHGLTRTDVDSMCRRGHLSVMQYLVGAMQFSPRRFGLREAIDNNRVELARYLIKNGWRLDNPYQTFNVFAHACRMNRVRIVRVLMEEQLIEIGDQLSPHKWAYPMSHGSLVASAEIAKSNGFNKLATYLRACRS